MDNDRDREPIELQKDFIENVSSIARQDDEGELECVSHSSFITELEERLSSTRKTIHAIEEKFPEYKP